jgi:hypothetical protein
MTLEEKVIKRRLLVTDIKKKKQKLLKLTAIYNRNHQEYCQMLKQHEKLDREIFMETKGVTKIERCRSGQQMQTNKQILTEAFMDSLSPNVREKLLQRLINKMEQAKINECQTSLNLSNVK